MQLRHYQQDAVRATWDWLCDRSGNPVIVLPTGAGKSLVIAQLAKDALAFGGRVLIVAHRKELLEQNAAKVRALLPGVKVGAFSAGLRRWDSESDIVCAGIQSCWNKPHIFGARHLVMIDEAHLVSTKNEGTYRKFLNDLVSINPRARVVGLTATPYRTGEGVLCGPEKLFQGVSYEAKIPRLIAEGYLCPITSQPAEHEADTSKLHVRGGEFVAGELEQLFGDMALVREATAETVAKCRDRKSIIVFCAGVNHALSVAREIEKLTGEHVGVVTGESTDLERAGALAGFRNGITRWLVNVDVLTTGFDAPNIDAIAVLRATCSPGLFAQICGRGFRLHPSKKDCLILDFGQNVERHGPLDSERYGQQREKQATGEGGPEKLCPNCDSLVPVSCRECSCGFRFPAPKPSPRHEGEAGDAELLLAQQKPQRWLVEEVRCCKWTNKKTGSITLRVDYECQLDGASGNLTKEVVPEWVCLEHDGFAGRKAQEWWRLHCHIPAGSIDEAVDLWQAGCVDFPAWIETKKDGRFFRIVSRGAIERQDRDDALARWGGYCQGAAIEEREQQVVDPWAIESDDEIPF